ncbi:hypothetical protein L1887_36080 [Cichorium endivia]|nr:hypothetical protein L1887_36080 [Cichorium endivia]
MSNLPIISRVSASVYSLSCSKMTLEILIMGEGKQMRLKKDTKQRKHPLIASGEASVGGGLVGWDEEDGETEEQTIAASHMEVGGGLLCEFRSRGAGCDLRSRGEAAGDRRPKNVLTRKKTYLTAARAWRRCGDLRSRDEGRWRSGGAGEETTRA